MEKGNEVYEKKILIRSEQVDMTRHLRMSELFRLMEEASIAHTEELGCTREKTLDRGLLWVITRQEAEIDELPVYDDEIIVRSWQGDMMHVIFPRFCEIIRDGKCLVRGRAMWMLINEETRDMVMPEDYDIFIPGRPGSDEIMLPAITLPPSAAGSGAKEKSSAGAEEKETARAGKKEAAGAGAAAGSTRSISMVTRFSQVDINGHMNNTRCFDIIDDLIRSPRISGSPEASATVSPDKGIASAETIKDKNGDTEIFSVPRKVSANYISELRLGDEFVLEEYISGDSVYYQGIADDRPAFKIRYDY